MEINQLLRSRATVTAEMRRNLGRHISLDGMFLTATPAVHLGVSVYALRLFYLQFSAGLPFYTGDSPLHGPGFVADYSYAIRGGVRVRTGERLTISVGAGGLFLVENDFCMNCSGGPSAGVVLEPAHEKRTESFDLWEVGIGLAW